MIPINPMIDPINQGDNPLREKLRKKFPEFFCPITVLMMVDPVQNLAGDTADRHSYYQSILLASPGGQKGKCPFNREEIIIAELVPNKWAREHIDRYLHPNTIQQRENYYRDLNQQTRLARFQADIRISQTDWNHTPPELFAFIEEHSDKIKSLYHYSNLSWLEFAAIDIATIRLFLNNIRSIEALIHAQISFQQLINTPVSRLGDLFNYPDLFQPLICTHQIGYEDFKSASEAVITTCINASGQALQFFLNTKTWFSWQDLSLTQCQWLIVHAGKIGQLKSQLLEQTFFSFLQHVIRHPEWLTWFSEDGSRFPTVLDFMHMRVSCRDILETPLERLSIFCQYPDLFQAFFEKSGYGILVAASDATIEVLVRSPKESYQFLYKTAHWLCWSKLRDDMLPFLITHADGLSTRFFKLG